MSKLSLNNPNIRCVLHHMRSNEKGNVDVNENDCTKMSFFAYSSDHFSSWQQEIESVDTSDLILLHVECPFHVYHDDEK